MSLPLIDARAAVAVGRRIVPPGPRLPPDEVASVVAGLRSAAAASVDPVVAVTHLELPADADPAAAILDRAAWVEANVTMALALLAEAGGTPLPAPATWRDHVAARANGAQLGGVLALLGTRILGQYLPFADRPRLVLVAPNVAVAERDLGVDRDDFRLWVCLHERTHHLQFAQAPWLRDHLARKVGELLADDEPDAPPRRWLGNLTRARTLVDVLATPRQRAVFDEVGAVMSLLEGYADVMMDRVGAAVVPSVALIRARFDRRRRRGGWVTVLNRAVGMDVKLAQYAEGAAFCRAVIDRVGVDGLNVSYSAPGMLPTPVEIREPARWVARVHG